MVDRAYQLDQMMRELTGDNADQLQKTADGRFVMHAARDSNVMVSVEALEEPARVVMQALIGSLSGPDSPRMARALLEVNAASAIQGGPAIALNDETDAIFTIRALPFETTVGTVLDANTLGVGIAAFIGQSVDLFAAIKSGKVLDLAASQDLAPEDFASMIKV